MSTFRFTVGPWNVHEGNETFGPGIRPSIPLEEKIKTLSERKKPALPAKKEKPHLPAELANLEESFRESLGTKVSLAGTNTRGKITIEYFSREDLERVFERISGKE